MVWLSLPIRRVLGACVVLAVAGVVAGPALGARGDISTVPTGQFHDPVDVVEAADGSLLVSHRVGVQRIAPDGTVTNAAGNPNADWRSPLGDGGPATSARLEPTGLAALPDGGFLVGDHGSDRVRRVFPDGHIDTVAGGGHNGDGCAATRAQLDDPQGISLTGDGGYLISDWANGRIVRVWPDGSLTTVAGDTSSAPGGHGTIATDTDLTAPSDVSAAADGSFLISGSTWNLIHRVAPDGRIHTVAGTGAWGLSGDGGPATAARLHHPMGVAAGAGGGFLIADQYNHRIRHVAPNGVIDTIAGSGPTGSANGAFGGDGGPATAARMNLPSAVSLRRGGGVLIADWWNHRIRAIDSPLQGAVPAPAGSFRGTGGYAGACLGLDPSFSGGSITVRDDGVVSSVVLQSDNKIVTGGAGPVPGRRIFLRRFIPDGRADVTFGDGGTVSSPAQANGRPIGLGYVTAMTEQPGTGGKLLVVGVSYEPDRERAVVARFTRDGQVDRSFGADGRTLLDGDLTSVSVAPNGHIVVAGSFSGASTAYIQKSLVGRLSADGRVDAAFGDGGTVVGPFTGQYSGVAGLADGRVIVSGEVGTGRPGLALQVGRFTESGELDPTFGDSGTAAAYPPAHGQAESHALAIQPDGKILVAGWAEYVGTHSGRRMMVARFTPAGGLDSSLAGDGIALVAPRGVDGVNPQASAYTLALQQDGKIVLAGKGFNGAAWSGAGFTVMRLTQEGAADPTFGPGGGYFTPVGDGGGAQGLAIQPDGKIVAAGDSPAGLGIARYGSTLPPGSPQDQGTATTPAGNAPRAPGSAPIVDRAPPAKAPAGERSTPARITLARLRPTTLRRLMRRGLPVRVQVSRPGTLSLRITAAAKRKPGRLVLATGSRRVLAGTSRVMLKPSRAVRARLAHMTPRRLRATLRAELVEAGGGQTVTQRRVTLRRR